MLYREQVKMSELMSDMIVQTGKSNRTREKEKR